MVRVVRDDDGGDALPAHLPAVQVGHVILGGRRGKCELAAADDCVAVLEELCAMCGVRSGVRGVFCALCGVRVCARVCVGRVRACVGEEVVDGDAYGAQLVRRRALLYLSFMSADAWRVHTLQPLRAPKGCGCVVIAGGVCAFIGSVF